MDEQSFVHRPSGVAVSLVLTPQTFARTAPNRQRLSARSTPASQVFLVRRLTAALLVTLAVVLAAQVFSAVRSSHSPAARPASLTVHVVQPGESLWTIARAVRPHGDLSHLVDAMIRANGGSTIQVGQELAIPG
jgi:Tfp pilus assembly protein FimV